MRLFSYLKTCRLVQFHLNYLKVGAVVVELYSTLNLRTSVSVCWNMLSLKTTSSVVNVNSAGFSVKGSQAATL